MVAGWISLCIKDPKEVGQCCRRHPVQYDFLGQQSDQP